MDEEYSNKMIEAFIDKPSVTAWYQNSFKMYDVNGVDTMKWNWSWWAFGGGFLYLLYRKEYLSALILFIVSSIAGMIFPLGLVIMILTGGFATYFVYKRYKQKLKEVENMLEDVDERVEAMRTIGGYNQWVIWVYGVFVAIFLLVIIYFLGIFINYRY